MEKKHILTSAVEYCGYDQGISHNIVSVNEGNALEARWGRLLDDRKKFLQEEIEGR
jgi:hypothetical protein